jgi:hypothetical protein
VTPARYWFSSSVSTDVGVFVSMPKLWLKMNTSLLFGLETDPPSESTNA